LMLGIQPIIDKLRGHENETLNRLVLQKVRATMICLQVSYAAGKLLDLLTL
jgi:hypothetical protein